MGCSFAGDFLTPWVGLSRQNIHSGCITSFFLLHFILDYRWRVALPQRPGSQYLVSTAFMRYGEGKEKTREKCNLELLEMGYQSLNILWCQPKQWVDIFLCWSQSNTLWQTCTLKQVLLVELIPLVLAIKKSTSHGSDEGQHPQSSFHK